MKNTTYKTLAASFMLVTVFMVLHTAHADNGPMIQTGVQGQVNAGAPAGGSTPPAGEGFFARLFHRDDISVSTDSATLGADATASAPVGRGAGMGGRIMAGMKNADSLVIGNVTAISGTSISMTGLDGTTYTVDASSATVAKGIGKDATVGAISSIAVGDKIAVAGTHSGTDIAATKIMYGMNGAMMKAAGSIMGDKPGMIGTVASVSGTTLTITGKDGTTYTVDASAAAITKGMGTSASTLAFSDIQVGDTVAVLGTFNGSTVTATKVIDGVSADMQGALAAAGWQKPAVSGSVTAVSGTTISVTGTDGTAYTVDASSAQFIKGGDTDGSTITIASIAVGDTVAVEGTLTGTNVVATKVIDGVRAGGMPQGGDTVASGSAPAQPSFLKKIGTLLGHLKFW